jgi:hypothetical protein
MKKRYLILPAAGLALIIALGYASAQTSQPDTENGRYTLNRVDGGWLRLDTRTGAVSTCAQAAGAWTCRLAPDERATLEGELSRAQQENATLKQELIKRGIALPQGMAQAPAGPAKSPEEPAIRLPSDADIDRVMGFMEKVMKRMIDFFGTITTEPGKQS